MLLGYGTKSAKKSKREHKAAVKVRLAGIEQVLEQEPTQADPEQVDAGQVDAGQGRAG
jgi:hypothetical protein